MNAVSMHAFRRRALLPFRLAFTAFAFALFGLGGIVFGFFLTLGSRWRAARLKKRKVWPDGS